MPGHHRARALWDIGEFLTLHLIQNWEIDTVSIPLSGALGLGSPDWILVKASETVNSYQRYLSLGAFRAPWKGEIHTRVPGPRALCLAEISQIPSWIHIDRFILNSNLQYISEASVPLREKCRSSLTFLKGSSFLWRCPLSGGPEKTLWQIEQLNDEWSLPFPDSVRECLDWSQCDKSAAQPSIQADRFSLFPSRINALSLKKSCQEQNDDFWRLLSLTGDVQATASALKSVRISGTRTGPFDGLYSTFWQE
jgi:hypothetical protein